MVLLAMEGGGIHRHLWESLLNRILSELVIVTGWVELNNSPRNAREAPWRQNGTVCTMGKEKGLEGNSELEGEGRRAERGGGWGGDFNAGSQGRGRWVEPGAVELPSKMEPEGPLLVVA